MKKKFGVLCLVLFAISFTSAYTHDASNVYLFLNGQNTNFQIAINSGNFSSSYVGGTYSSQIIFGHNASEIIVNVNGTVKSFQNAINDGSLNSTLAGRSPANYVGYNMIHGEYGTNITLTNRSGFQKSLQTAINDGEFKVCVPNCVGKICGDNGCGGVCGSCLEDKGYKCVSGICKPFKVCEFDPGSLNYFGTSTILFPNQSAAYCGEGQVVGYCGRWVVVVWKGKYIITKSSNKIYYVDPEYYNYTWSFDYTRYFFGSPGPDIGTTYGICRIPK